MVSKDFLTAGHAIFTVSSPKADSPHYTFKVTKPDDQSEDEPIWFVNLLTGPDNLSDYSYLGILKGDGTVRVTGKSKFQPTVVDGKPVDAKPVAVAKWAIGQIWHGKVLPDGYKIEHIGKCAACGRALTTPESLESGLGPVCDGRGKAKKAEVDLDFKVGDGATKYSGSDRHAYTVVDIISAKEVVVQADIATPAEGHDYYGEQKYTYAPDPTAPRVHVTRRANGRWVEKGDSAKGFAYAFVGRFKYFDPSF